MSPLSRHEVTRLLQAWNLGEDEIIERLLPLVYDELHRLAHLYMSREAPGTLLQTTALINEAYLKITELTRIEWKNRNHFVGMAAQMMRRILVDFARTRNARKRGGDLERVPFDDKLRVSTPVESDLERLDAALDALGREHPRKAKVVELRYFGGFTAQETAEVLEVSPETVQRDWKFARAWLLREIQVPPSSD